MTMDDLRRVWQERSSPGGGARAGCLDEETFAALLSGEMDAKARAEAGNHIALCQDCADEFRALRSMGVLFGARRKEKSSRLPLVLALAASVLLAAGLSIALLRYRAAVARSEAELSRLAERERALVDAGTARDAEITSLRERLDSAVSARLDAPIVDLDPFHATRGSDRGDVPTVDVGQGVDLLTLILNFPPRRPREGFRVEVFDESEGLRFEGIAPRRQDGASVNLTLSRAVAPDGVYRIRLSDGGDTIAEYRVRLRYAGEPR